MLANVPFNTIVALFEIECTSRNPSALITTVSQEGTFNAFIRKKKTLIRSRRCILRLEELLP